MKYLPSQCLPFLSQLLPIKSVLRCLPLVQLLSHKITRQRTKESPPNWGLDNCSWCGIWLLEILRSSNGSSSVQTPEKVFNKIYDTDKSMICRLTTVNAKLRWCYWWLGPINRDSLVPPSCKPIYPQRNSQCQPEWCITFLYPNLLAFWSWYRSISSIIPTQTSLKMYRLLAFWQVFISQVQSHHLWKLPVCLFRAH